MSLDIKSRHVSKEELVSGLRNTVTCFNDSSSHKFGVILFGSRARETNRLDSDVDLFYFCDFCPDDEYSELICKLNTRVDNFLLRFGIVHPFPYRWSFRKGILFLALEDEDYRKKILQGRLGLLDKHSLYIGSGEEEHTSLLERALELGSREPYSLMW